MLKKSYILVLVLLAFFAACKKEQPTNANTETQTIVDQANRKVTIPNKLDRVVSLAPHLTEIIYAINAQDKLVGVTSYCDYPAEAKKLPQVGDIVQPDVNRIIQLKPQLVFVSTSAQMKDFEAKLEEANIPYFVTDPHDLDSIFKTILTMSVLLGKNESAQKLVADLRTRAQAIQDKVKDRPNVAVFYQVSPEPIFSIGSDSYLTDLISKAGGRSVTSNMKDASFAVKDTTNFTAQPEAIVMPVNGAVTAKKLTVAPFLQESSAVKNSRVYGISDYLLARPGPRIVDGLEELARTLQPEAFK